MISTIETYYQSKTYSNFILFVYLNFDYSFFIAVRNRKERAMRGDRNDSERSRSRDRKDSRDVRLRLGHRDRDSDRGKLCLFL